MRISLFIPCYIEHLRPEAGLATVALLDRLGLDWDCPQGQTCCGQPVFNIGHAQDVLPAARHFLERFGEAETVVAPSGSCVAMLRRFATLPGLAAAEIELLRSLSERCYELADFLVNRLGIVDLGARWPGRAVFQDCCHTLRELGLRDEARRLLAEVDGLELLDQPGLDCCGFGGLYSIKLPELSVAQADDRLAAMAAVGCSTLIATDVSCLLHLEARARKRGLPWRGLYLAEVLAGDSPATAANAPGVRAGMNPPEREPRR